MPAGDSRIRVKRVDDVSQVEFVDRNILDEGNIQVIREEIEAIIASESSPKVLISFANVEHMSSAALGILIEVNKKIRGKSGQLRLANIDAPIYEVFIITRLSKIFQIHPTTEEAMKSFTA